MILEDAKQVISDALMQHCEDCISTDQEQKAKIDAAWSLVSNMADEALVLAKGMTGAVDGPEKKYAKCPECGAEVEYSHTPSEQEYPGASIWPARDYWECTECGWEHGENAGCIEGQENTRGW